MSKTPAPPPAPAPAPPSAPAATLKQSPRASVPTALPLKITTGVRSTAERIVIYGTGGIGKSTLAMYLPGALWFDVENGATHLPIANAGDVTDWLTLRGMLASIEASPPKGVKSIVVDTVTVAEELAKEHVISTRSTEKGKSVDSIEGFGWGKGWQFVYEEFNGLLADLDRIWSKGINVCLIAHEVASPVPNPMGEDYIRWEPHLFSGDKKGRGSVRDRVKQWADHVLFVAYDVYAKEGKAQGSGTRTIYSAEMPTHIAKSRVSQVALPFQLENPGAVWSALGITQ